MSWFDTFYESLSPAKKRNMDRRLKASKLEIKLYDSIPWMKWPILQYIYAFWTSLFEEGIRETCKPRWGTITFGWLNDGIRPTVWHTWRQLTHNHLDRYCGIYPDGAPKSYKQAVEWEEKWENERELKERMGKI